jgi:hypothetical protein
MQVDKVMHSAYWGLVGKYAIQVTYNKNILKLSDMQACATNRTTAIKQSNN